jgi:hypothetical protein
VDRSTGKAREMPKEQFKQEVEKELTGWEGLNVTTAVFANHYAVLKREFSYLGVGSPTSGCGYV